MIAVLTLSAAVSYALAHSPAVSKHLAAVSAARAEYVQTRSKSLPGITGSLQNTMQKSQNYAGVYSIIGTPQASVYSQNTAQLGTSYTWNGGLAHIQTLIARQQYEQAESQLHQAQEQVTNDVTNAFYGLAAKNETVRLDAADLRYQDVLVRVAQAKERAGVAAGVDVLSARAEQQKSLYALQAALADAQNARESLAQSIGAPLTTVFAVPFEIVQPPMPSGKLDALISVALENRPEIVSSKYNLDIAQLNRRTADTDLFPQVQTFAGFGNQFSPTLAVQQSAFGPVSRGNPGFWNIGVTSTISLPLLDWGARRANHRNLDEQIALAQADLQTTGTQVELDVRESYRSAQTALAQLRSAQDETRFALEASRVARLQYEHGLISLTDVLQRQQTSLSAQTDLFNARVAYVDALVRLRVALGTYTPERAVADLSMGTK